MPTTVPWYQAIFEDSRPFFDLVPQKTTNNQVRYLIKKLRLKPGMSFLDCPCGIGRVSLPLAKKGIRVVGSDLCGEYLDELKFKARKARVQIETVLSDMRKIDFKNRFDTAGHLWTSFGYFESERQNLLVLKKMYQALKPGGRFCLHTVNRDWILAYYTDTEWQDLGSTLFTLRRKFDFATSTNRAVWTFYRDGNPSVHQVNVRMYSYHELIAMFKQVGFVNIEGFGSTDDAPISQHTMMMWIFGVKPR